MDYPHEPTYHPYVLGNRSQDGKVSLIDENGEIVNTIESVFCDNLVAVIDSAVEKCENYEERISQEYGIITKSEK